MVNPFRKWRRGVEVSEISLVLPFVQISLKPAEESSAPGNPTVIPATSQSSSRQLSIQLDAGPNAISQFIDDELVEVDYFYRVPTYFARKRTVEYWRKKYSLIGYAGYEKVGKDVYDCPVFESKWRRLHGNITFHTGELVWFMARFSNISGRVIYRLPHSLFELPFLEGLDGFCTYTNPFEYQISYYFKGQKHWANYTATEIECEWHPNNIRVGWIKDHSNPGSSEYVHCLCRAPVIQGSNKGNYLFDPYVPRNSQQYSNDFIRDLMNLDFKDNSISKDEIASSRRLRHHHDDDDDDE